MWDPPWGPPPFVRVSSTILGLCKFFPIKNASRKWPLITTKVVNLLYQLHARREKWKTCNLTRLGLNYTWYLGRKCFATKKVCTTDVFNWLVLTLNIYIYIYIKGNINKEIMLNCSLFKCIICMWEHEKASGSITDCWCPFLRLARNPKFQKKSKAQRPNKKTEEQERPKNKKEIKAKNYV